MSRLRTLPFSLLPATFAGRVTVAAVLACVSANLLLVSGRYHAGAGEGAALLTVGLTVFGAVYVALLSVTVLLELFGLGTRPHNEATIDLPAGPPDPVPGL